MVGFAPVKEVLEESVGEMVGEPNVVIEVFGVGVRGAVKEDELLVLLEKVGGLTLGLALFGHVESLHEAGGVGVDGVLADGELFHVITQLVVWRQG